MVKQELWLGTLYKDETCLYMVEIGMLHFSFSDEATGTSMVLQSLSSCGHRS